MRNYLIRGAGEPYLEGYCLDNNHYICDLFFVGREIQINESLWFARYGTFKKKKERKKNIEFTVLYIHINDGLQNSR